MTAFMGVMRPPVPWIQEFTKKRVTNQLWGSVSLKGRFGPPIFESLACYWQGLGGHCLYQACQGLQ
eukprot:1498837-Pyramimonas_sp.AAC.1